MEECHFSWQHTSYATFREAVACMAPAMQWGGESSASNDPESLARFMLGIIPQSLGGDVHDWEPGDESATMVHNMVSTSIVHGSSMPINLPLLAMLLPCSTYDRKRFAAITIRIDNPRCTALLFTSGKLVITGVKSWYECLLASLCVASIISSLFAHAKYFITDCDTQNIVAHSEIHLRNGQFLDIQRMYESMSMECTYQKNMFPGLIYRSKDAPVVLLCFYSGKVVLTGGKSLHDIEWGWNMLWKIVRRYISSSSSQQQCSGSSRTMMHHH
jgi:transcription initiation factor TFIID TATA-box-binding protein